MDALVIAGPTASGKTALALALAKQMPAEIINMDSALVYKGMDIGTAKPSLEERRQVVHHLIDVVDLNESYSAADFIVDVERLVPEIQARGKMPIIVGGTLLYLHSWQNGLSDLPSANEHLRTQLQQEWEADPAAMHARLSVQDPIAGKRIHPNDPQRIIRALEVITLTGSTLTEQQQQRKATDLDLAVVFIEPPTKAWLHERIEQRWQQMMHQGLIDEVKWVMQATHSQLDLPAMRCVGYRQIAQYLLAEINLAEMEQQALSATRSLAKRQLTWMKKMSCHLRLNAESSTQEQQLDVMSLIKSVQ